MSLMTTSIPFQLILPSRNLSLVKTPAPDDEQAPKEFSNDPNALMLDGIHCTIVNDPTYDRDGGVVTSVLKLMRLLLAAHLPHIAQSSVIQQIMVREEW